MSKKIGIIFWDGWLGVAPTLLSIIAYFSEKNYHVFVYLRDDNEFDLSIIETFNKEQVTFRRIPTKANSFKKSLVDTALLFLRKAKDHHWISLDKFNLILFRAEQLKSYFEIIHFSNQIKKSQEKNYEATFCVDTIGLFAHRKSKMQSEKTINLSLELLYDLESDKEWLNKLIKKNERFYLKHKVAFTLIQDSYRWAIYKRINKVEEDNFLVLPNSTRKNSESELIQKSDFFYKRFNLDSETVIVLSAGMICDEVCSHEIAQVVGNYNFKTKTKIIFHNRIKNDVIRQLYIEEVRLVGKDNVCLSLDPVLFSELHTVFNSAQIGLVIYNTENEDENFSAIGAASGKLYQYLKYGLPVIVSNLPGLKEIVLENEIGLTVDSPSDIPEAIEKINSNYQWYSNNAKLAFDNKLNIDTYLDVINKLL